MAQYRVLKYMRIGAQPHWPGEVIELTEIQARDINRDEAGTVEQLGRQETGHGSEETRAVEAAPRDRMQKKAGVRSQ